MIDPVCAKGTLSKLPPNSGEPIREVAAGLSTQVYRGAIGLLRCGGQYHWRNWVVKKTGVGCFSKRLCHELRAR